MMVEGVARGEASPAVKRKIAHTRGEYLYKTWPEMMKSPAVDQSVFLSGSSTLFHVEFAP
jgi:hypothetical protein